MVESGAGTHGERADRPRAGRAHPGVVDELGPEFTETDHTVVELLTGLGPLTTPDGSARDRMRARITASLMADPLRQDSGDHAGDQTGNHTAGQTGTSQDRHDPAGSTTVAPERRPEPRPGRPPRAGRAPRGRRDPDSAPPGRLPSPGPRGSTRARFAVAAVAALALVFSLTGMSLLLARDALPGDALYGVKRTGEAAALGLTFGTEEKAFKHLEFATSRVTEIETLAARFADPADAPTDGYLAALGDFDNDTTAGARGLTAVATSGDGSQLTALRDWADQQGARLAALRAKLPSATDSRVSASLGLLDRISSRAAGLLARVPCYQVTSGDLDDIGALPATGTCQVRPDAPRVLVTPPSSQADTAPGIGVPQVTTTPAAPTVPTGQPPASEPTRTSAPPPPRTTTAPPLVNLPPIIGAPTQTAPGTSTPAAPGVTVPLPLPLPTIALPPLLPGLGAIQIG
ncbi:DUF5667 domain-containing protein [Actinokineospora inagensis]|uniref:DUF5667 domain-containing protein n=1 Tax=Actinokineospora inagensis TaxID=103730 RepID=UPI00041160AD|nr:DUF5667 domain-containing protein [Actinokineospora inagensis]